MTPEEFRKHGHTVVDWIADYMAHIRDYPVMSRNAAGDLIRALPVSAPEEGEPFEQILSDFERHVMPAVTHWNHPGFLSYFSVSGAPPGILGEFLTAALNVNGMVWKSCPAVTELEQVTMSWLRQWLGLPPEWFGIIYDTASTSTLHALVAARVKAQEQRGLGCERLVTYCSEQAHSSVEKDAITAGIPRANVRKIACDDQFRMRVDSLEEAIEKDAAAGLFAFCITATTGTTPTAAIDPIPAIAKIARHLDIWLHVDGAYGGMAAIVPERRWVLAGIEHADSLVVNPHKWMLTPIDLSAFYTRRPEWLRRAFSLTPEYLRTAEQTENLMDYGMQLGRRFRALKLWFTMRSYGHRALAGFIDNHCHMAQELVSWIEADGRFEICAPVHFSLVCLRFKGSDEENQRLLDRANATGAAFLSPTTLHGRLVIRFAIGNYQTTRDDVRQAWEAIRQAVA
ncbi:MAG: aminotransferase class I/II-fold pyridoxal phosphate-dependent enzyme [Bryobacteraceae bacterium]